MPLIDRVGFEPTQAFYCLQILSLFRLNQSCGTDRQQAKHGLNVRDLTHSYRQKSFKYFPSVFCPFISIVILISNTVVSESNHTIGKPIEPLFGFYGVILNM